MKRSTTGYESSAVSACCRMRFRSETLHAALAGRECWAAWHGWRGEDDNGAANKRKAPESTQFCPSRTAFGAISRKNRHKEARCQSPPARSQGPKAQSQDTIDKPPNSMKMEKIGRR